MTKDDWTLIAKQCDRLKTYHPDKTQASPDVVKMLEFCDEARIDHFQETKNIPTEARDRTRLIGKMTWLDNSTRIIDYIVVGLAFAIASMIQVYLRLLLEPWLYAVFHVPLSADPPTWFVGVMFLIEAVIFFGIVLLVAFLRIGLDKRNRLIQSASVIQEYVTHRAIEARITALGMKPRSRRRGLL